MCAQRHPSFPQPPAITSTPVARAVPAPPPRPAHPAGRQVVKRYGSTATPASIAKDIEAQLAK